MRKHSHSMLNGPLLPSIIAYTIPIILTSVLQLLFNAADLVIVGRFCGSVSVAAVGATGAISNLIINLFVGLSVGAGVTVAHALGAKEDTTVHRAIHTLMPTALVSGAVLTVVGVVFSEDLLTLMGTDPDVLPLSTVYMQIYFGGITFNMVYNFCSSALRAAGDTKSPLLFLSIAGVVNVALNVVFVTVLHMNVAGVALATTISQGISAVLVVIALMRRTDCCKLDLRKMRFYKPQLLKMIRIGLPAGIQGSLFSISNVIIQSSVNSFGKVVMSGNAAAGNIDGFVYVAMNAFHQTAVNFVGQNIGAHQYKRVKQTLVICMASTLVVGVALSLLAYHFGETLLGIYITDSAEAIRYGMIRMFYVTLPYALCGVMETATGALRGMGASTVPMLVSILGVCGFRLGWLFTIFRIPEYHTLESLYLSYPISWVATGIAQIVAFVIVYRRRVRWDQKYVLKGLNAEGTSQNYHGETSK